MLPVAGWNGPGAPAFDPNAVAEACHRIRESAFVVVDPGSGAIGVAFDGSLVPAEPAESPSPGSWPVHGVLPPLYPEWLGDRSFNETHGTRFPYVTGAMANGIATTRLVIEMARSRLSWYSSAPAVWASTGSVEAASMNSLPRLGDTAPWGCNLIHSPNEPALEAGRRRPVHQPAVYAGCPPPHTCP